MKIFGKTDQGRRRSNNEDSFYVDSDLGFMVVADGMGGHASGEVASQLAVNLTHEQFKRALKTGQVPIFTHVPNNPRFEKKTHLLGDCLKFSNQAVYEAAQSNPAHHNMGTTLLAALWLDNKLAVAHVGDSRLYFIRGGDMTQCTVDHSFVQEQVDKGLLKPEEAEKSDMRNMLTRSVGVSDEVDVDISEIELSQGDYILLCSDGLTKMVPDKKIEAAFHGESEPEQIVERLIGMANDAGGTDNITVIVAHVEGPPSTWSSLSDRMKSVFK